MCIYCHICAHIEVTRLAYLYAYLMSRAGNILASGTSTHRPPKYTSSCRMCHIYTVVLLAEYSVQIMGSRRLVSFSPPYIYISFLPPSIQSGYSAGGSCRPTARYQYQYNSTPLRVCWISVVAFPATSAVRECHQAHTSIMVNTCLLDRSEPIATCMRC